jgi:hypothetical protein
LIFQNRSRYTNGRDSSFERFILVESSSSFTMMCLVASYQNLRSLFIRSFPVRNVLQIWFQFSMIMGLWMFDVLLAVWSVETEACMGWHEKCGVLMQSKQKRRIAGRWRTHVFYFKVLCSMIEWVRRCLPAEVCHFENLVYLTAPMYCHSFLNLKCIQFCTIWESYIYSQTFPTENILKNKIMK